MNKLQKFDEMAGFPHVIQAEFSEVFRKDYHWKSKWNEMFFMNNHPIVLELGCGKGEYTVELARRFPDKNFIGIDIKGARMHLGASQSLNENLKNVAFIRTRIEMVDSFFGEGEIDEIWLTFPDPQMSKTRKRLTSTNFLNRYSKFLKTAGAIHLKTDSNFQYTYTTALVRENNFKIVEEYTDLYRQNPDNELLSIKTYYENRFLEHNIPIKYLQFIPDFSTPLREPCVEIPHDAYHNAGRGVKPYHKLV
ncbi:MAG: tRNA (guanosine(46)-N7)-methyltransferase TrmB [Cytophagaceae bacterium]|jgi:tRNA (guanine-N7-)-methyltransferase|nr:tRNA (guanosine(46)-N7)-methyltransferase TrmB [Cytophagaceae bacterium]